MKILYYDCFSGISGDMNLAAMIDLGIDAEYLRSELSKLGLDDEFELKISKDSRKGIFGTRVDVILKHAHEHGAHTHHTHSHEHRTLKDIESLIEQSVLEDGVKKTACDIFRKVAEAEANVHGKALYEVHFHEVGATDSIVDIVGAAICFHALKVDAVWCSSVELGGGFIKCAHGTMPVPAPATAEILHGCPTTRGAVKKEATTPTGAAIVAALADRFTDTPKFSVDKTAYGVGHRDTRIPNLLRVHMATPVDAAVLRDNSENLEDSNDHGGGEEVPVEFQSATENEQQADNGWKILSARLLQCNIDDMTGEMLGVVMDKLMEEGAMDVHFTPIMMKKNRPATSISLLCSTEEEARFKRILFQHTTTLGIKSIPIEKTELVISFDKLETPLGSVKMKNAVMNGKVIRSKPELEDCKALSKRHDMPLGDVYLQIGKHRTH